MRSENKKEKDFLGLLGAILFISPNLNIPESILTYCGVSSHDTALIISVVLFGIADLIIALLFFRSSPTGRMYGVIIAFNAVYILPLLFKLDKIGIIQYMLFVAPVTVVGIMLARDVEIRGCFMKYLRHAMKLLLAVAVIYIVLQYTATERDQYGMIVIENMTYGDMAYLFLTGFVVSVIECVERRYVIGFAGIVVFSVSIVFSGARSAVLCVICAVILFFIIAIIAGSGKEKASVLSLITIATIVSIIMSMFILPDGSRFKVNNIDATSSDFSVQKIIFETEAQKLGDTTVIYAPTGEERKLHEIYEEEIVKSDNTKYDTESMLRNDVINNTNEYIILIDEEKDREAAENYSIHFYRTFLWRTALKEFKKHPLLGNGPYYFKNKYNGYFPHNIFLEAMADCGLVGLLILLVLGSCCLINGIGYYLKHKEINVYYMIVLLFSHFPRYVLYTTLYSNTTLAITVIFFMTIGKIGINEKKESTITEKI